MTWDEVLVHCLAKPGAWQDEPWDGDVVVKISSKIFAFLGSTQGSAVGVKCGGNREAANEWLLRYPPLSQRDREPARQAQLCFASMMTGVNTHGFVGALAPWRAFGRPLG